VACASCHFHAGADPRTQNQVSPGLLRVAFELDEAGDPIAVAEPDFSFDGQGPNYQLKTEDFPLRLLADPTDRESPILRNTNNVVASQGVFYSLYGAFARPGPDPEGFRVGKRRNAANVRRVEPRNTPTMINAVFNHRNFWDLRAQDLFNGVNPFGDRDAEAFVYSAEHPRKLKKVQVLLENSSLASQAVGPPTNRFEMSDDGRTFLDVGRSLTLQLGQLHRDSAQRLRTVRPLAKQLVHPEDSVLGAYSRWPLRGLRVDYESLIRRAFQPRWWASQKLVRVAADGSTALVAWRPYPAANEFSLIEYNFSLFFGLAVQMYEATLVADDTPFDRFLKDPVGATSSSPGLTSTPAARKHFSMSSTSTRAAATRAAHRTRSRRATARSSAGSRSSTSTRPRMRRP
jgi:hypothetical protein